MTDVNVVVSPNRRAAFFSAANLNGISAVLFCISLGSVPGAFLFGGVVLLGILNKLEALGRDRFARHNLLVLKPEVTATVLMTAASLNALTGLVTYAVYALPITALQPWFPQHFTGLWCQLLLAFAWGGGAAGDYGLKLNDRRRFSGIGAQGRTALVLVLGNPSFWYAFACIGTTVLGLFLIGVGSSPLQLAAVVAGVAVNLLAIGYGVVAVLKQSNRAGDGTVNMLGAAAQLLAALQPLAAGLHGHALPLFGAQLVCAASSLMIGRELRAQSLRTAMVPA